MYRPTGKRVEAVERRELHVLERRRNSQLVTSQNSNRVPTE